MQYLQYVYENSINIRLYHVYDSTSTVIEGIDFFVKGRRKRNVTGTQRMRTTEQGICGMHGRKVTMKTGRENGGGGTVIVKL